MIGLCVTVKAAEAQKAPYLTGTIEHRSEAKQTAKRKCLPRPSFLIHPARLIPVELRPRTLQVAVLTHVRLMYRGKNCLPTSPEGIIRYVFPSSTEDAAVRVARCESGLWPWAKNPVSSASGLFQLLSSHWAGRFNPFDPWANTRYAYRLSNAGTDWSPWVCSPY